MNSPRIVVGGVDMLPEYISGEDGISVVIKVDKGVSKAVTATLTAFGALFDVIKANLIDPPGARLAELPISIFDPCSGTLLFQGVIRGDLVDWCEGECKCDFTCVEKTIETALVDGLTSTLIYDNWNGIQEQDHPRMVYCNEMPQDFIQIAIMILGSIIVAIMYMLTPIIAVFSVLIQLINTIIDGVNLVPGVSIDHIDFDGDDSTTFLQEYVGLRDNFIETVIGCGRKHPSPLVRAYLLNVVEKFGGAFQSTILNNAASDYFNTVLFNAPFIKGTRNESQKMKSENLPILTGTGLLDKLALVFNARYGVRTIAGVPTLVFERHDVFAAGMGVWVDPMQLKAAGRLEAGLCYSWNSDAPAALLDIGFAMDPTDGPANEAKPVYHNIVEWNQPFSASQKGIETRAFEFGMVRCRHDQVSGGDVLDAFDLNPLYASALSAFQDVMLLERGTAGLPKLIIWDGLSLLNGKVKRGYNEAFYTDDNGLHYVLPYNAANAPYWVDDHTSVPSTEYLPDVANGNLYKRFHALDAPKINNRRGITFKFAWQYNAEEITSMVPLASVPLPIGVGSTTQITINCSKGTIEVVGVA